MNQSEKKCTQIVEAAIAEFLERGFLGASMDRISDHANVSKRTVYNHFESKEILFSKISDQLAERVLSKISISYNPDASIRDELLRLGWAQGELALDPDMMRMARMVLGEATRDKDFVWVMSHKMSFEKSITAFFAAAAEHNQLNIEDPYEAGEQFCGMIKSRAFYPQLFGSPLATREDLMRYVEDAVEMFLARYGVVDGKASAVSAA
ncbi:MAG: TetR/AcrR family transcriptional regulator [Rhodobacteraceae bacterium]|nr:TetR/AcrR family transcriptional regulator [Paracoccaceae bacterium]